MGEAAAVGLTNQAFSRLKIRQKLVAQATAFRPLRSFKKN